MIMSHRIIVTLGLIGCWAVWGAGPTAADMRMWTDAGGHELEARFVETLPDNRVVLESPDGRRITVRPEHLGEADRAFLEQAGLIEEEEDFTADRIRDPWLPAFERGPYAGNFAVHDGPLYKFVMAADGTGELYLKDHQGQIVGPAIPVRAWRSHYVAPDDRKSREGEMRSYTRAVKKLTGPPLRPMMNPASIELNGLLDDDVVFKKTYRFARNSIQMEFEITDPRGIQYPTRGSETGFRRYEATDKITSQTPLEERKRIMDGWKMTLHHRGRGVRPTTIAFWEASDRRHSNIDRAAIEGPWGPRKLTVDFRGAPGRISLYEGRELFTGYSMSFSWLWENVRRPGLYLSID